MLRTEEHNMMPTNQSVYRKFHSTETALLRLSYIQRSAGCYWSRSSVWSVSTGSHSSAWHSRPRTAATSTRSDVWRPSLRGQAIEWLKSYMSGRSYCVIYGGKTSSAIQVICSVPQRSVLGPLLFILYTADLADLASKFGVKLHAFSDDNQLQLTNPPY